MIKIYIPSRARAAQQVTLAQLPGKLLQSTTVVIGPEDEAAYTKMLDAFPVRLRPGLLVAPKKVDSIGKVRQWIIDMHASTCTDGRLIMLDDDLRFSTRRQDDNTKFLPATDTDKIACFETVNATLKKYAHCGIMAREGANHEKMLVDHENTRLLRALAYDAHVLVRECVQFDRLIVMEDFDVALQLLRKGYKSIALARWVQDQGGSNAPGGCSIYRTLEKQKEGALGLAKLHGPFVKVIEKQTGKESWGGQLRTDVIVYWKDAFDSSQK